VLVPVVKSEEQSWYEIDGVRIRLGQLTFGTNFRWDENRIIHTDSYYSHFKTQTLSPVIPTLPETLMTSWSYRGGVLEFQSKTEVKDLVPIDADKSGRGTGQERYLRQKDEFRTSLYNDFFNASDKAFADANPKWALSADVTSSRIFLGYYWGVFIPIGDYHRFIKFGAGLGVYNIDLSFKLNLCSQFISTGTEGGCIGKKEIDSYSGKKLGITLARHMTLWERRTKDSIWRFFKVSEGLALGSNDKGLILVKLKNHSKNLALWMSSLTIEMVSYTYRF
jgi:hypothetical protein